MSLNHDLPVAAAGRGQAFSAKAIALFLDFDGTLVEIAEDPDAIQVPARLPALLGGLKLRLGGAVALASGRSIERLDRFLQPLTLDAAGLHGAETRIGALLSRRQADPSLREAARWIEDRLGQRRLPLLLEDKGASIALHWRRHPDLADAGAELMRQAHERIGPRYRLQPGAAVLELVPATASKGAALRWFMEREPYKGRQPVFIGDDLTDEAGFEAAQALGGVSVKVGEGATHAARRLASVAHVHEALRELAAGKPLASIWP